VHFRFSYDIWPVGLYAFCCRHDIEGSGPPQVHPQIEDRAKSLFLLILGIQGIFLFESRPTFRCKLLPWIQGMSHPPAHPPQRRQTVVKWSNHLGNIQSNLTGARIFSTSIATQYQPCSCLCLPIGVLILLIRMRPYRGCNWLTQISRLAK